MVLRIFVPRGDFVGAGDADGGGDGRLVGAGGDGVRPLVKGLLEEWEKTEALVLAIEWRQSRMTAVPPRTEITGHVIGARGVD